MALVHTSPSAPAPSSCTSKKGFRHTFRRWKACLLLKPSPASQQQQQEPPRTDTPAPYPVFTTNPFSTVAPPPCASPPPPADQPSPHDIDAVALFKPTTQTIIHSPLDKRNKAVHLFPTSSLRRSYLGARRNTAPADYFAFGATRASVDKKDAWSPNETTSPSASAGAPLSGHNRRPSLLRFSLSKRGSMHQASQSASMAVAPVLGASRPVAQQKEQGCTRQAAVTATAEMAALVEKHQRLAVDVGGVGKKDSPNGSPVFERKEEKEGEGEGEGLRREEKTMDVNAEKRVTDGKVPSTVETENAIKKHE